jgi:hypothetical protein
MGSHRQACEYSIHLLELTIIIGSTVRATRNPNESIIQLSTVHHLLRHRYLARVASTDNTYASVNVTR